ncbi:terminase small subunit [Pararhodobacter sp. CCB-MM2]|uniref:terminase small subunit n=1 Tax=Pararhodobacter sp. CCB-MM2 TaxID=1786003 RepID=UPI0008331C73|nr:terminase small subunit [Pararhodobacter sp. CCB-MM2]
MGNNLPAKRGFGTGAGWKRRIETPDELLAKFEEYTAFAKENLAFPVELIRGADGKLQGTKFKPGTWTIVSFCHFLGVTRYSWDDWNKHRTDLREAIDVIEERIRDHNRRGADAGVFHAGMAALDLEREERKRARLEAQSEAPTVASELVANIVHPDMTSEQFDLYTAAGVSFPLYTQQQLDAGFPLILPPLPSRTKPWEK